MSIPPPPPFDHRRLPNPSVCSNGQRPCNEPYTIDGEVVGHCSVLVWPPQLQGRFRRAGHVGKPHRVEWWPR